LSLIFVYLMLQTFYSY